MGDGYVSTKDGVEPLAVPDEYLIIRAVQAVKGAISPIEIAPNLHPASVWAHYILMTEKVHAEVEEMRSKKSGNRSDASSQKSAPMSFSLSRPK